MKSAATARTIKAMTRKRNLLFGSIIVAVVAGSFIIALILLNSQSSPVEKTVPEKLSLGLFSNQTSVLQGGEIQDEVNVTSNRPAENITLNAQTGTSGIISIFEPSVSHNNFTSFLNIKITDSAPTGNYSISITASGDGQTATSSFDLSVLSANVTVSGRIEMSTGYENGYLTSLVFYSEQTNTNQTIHIPHASMQGLLNGLLSDYSVTLQNNQTYIVWVNYFQGDASLHEFYPVQYYFGPY